MSPGPEIVLKKALWAPVPNEFLRKYYGPRSRMPNEWLKKMGIY
jgi:hypothetical protein